MEERKHIVILADGDFPTHRVPLRALEEADCVVCCDGAYRGWIAHGHGDRDCYVVGDGDSLPADIQRQLGGRYIKCPDQETNDLTKAMQFVAAHFGEEAIRVDIVGATGKREDHTLGNLSLMADYAECYTSLPIALITDYGRFTAVKGKGSFESFERQQVSIFSLTPEVPVSVSGLQYPIEGRCLRRWWEGTLNAAMGDSFIAEGGLLLVYQTHDPKR